MEKEIVISRFEYELLKVLVLKGFKYIARDFITDPYCGLWFYRNEPCRDVSCWYSDVHCESYNFIDETHFPYIKWEDKEPTLIKELIALYEFQERI